MHITVQKERVYGKILVYPVCAKAKLFAAIAGTKTLSTNNLKRINSLGYLFLFKQLE